MATRVELVQKLAKRRFNNQCIPNLTRAQVRQAAQGLTNAEWDKIIEGISSNNDGVVGKVLAGQVHEYLLGLATADVETWLADDTLTLDQLLELI